MTYPKDWTEIVNEAAAGGFLRLVVSKPVQQAIGRLVYGVFDVPTAYLESWALRVRSDNIARKQITSAVALAAKGRAAGDDALIQAGLDRWTNKIQARQRSVDEVAARAVVVLAEEEVPPDARAPDEDFMRMFEEIAERASSENIADLLARILAGEIRKPRSVSIRTLQVVTVMDQPIVVALKEVAPFCMDNGSWHIPPSRKQEWGTIFNLLNTVAITTRPELHWFKFDEKGESGLRRGNKGIVFSAPRSIKFGLAIDGAALTPIGEELLSILPFDRGSKVEAVANGLKELPQVESVHVGDIVEGEGGWSISYGM